MKKNKDKKIDRLLSRKIDRYLFILVPGKETVDRGELLPMDFIHSTFGSGRLSLFNLNKRSALFYFPIFTSIPEIDLCNCSVQ